MGIELRNVEGLAEPPAIRTSRSSAARLVFTAGAVPLDEHRRARAVPEDAEAQTQQVLANSPPARSGGATPADVVKTTVCVAGGSS